MTSQLTSGTVTSVGLSSATSGVTIGSSPITTSGTITLAIATASGSQNGLLSSTDWTTFNNKQNALTNPITGTGTRTLNYLPLFSGSTNSIENSSVYEVFTPEENIGVYVANTLKVQNALIVTGNINAVATTLTGALSGTSATFSSSVGVNSTIRSTGQTDPASGVGMELFYRAADTSSYIQSYDRTNGAWKDVRIYGNTLYFWLHKELII